MTDYHEISLWHETAEDEFAPRPSLASVERARRVFDVAIVGAGYTGLWTAYYLSQADPSLRIAIVEAQVAGFGASGRNGGWCSALYPVSLSTLAAQHGRDQAIRQYQAMQHTVTEVGRVIEAERLAADWARGGTIVLSRSQPQLDRARAEVEQARAFGFGPADLRLLDQAEASQRLQASGVLGGTYTGHCAAIQPAKLVRGLARLVTAAGVQLYERSPVTAIEPGRLRTADGDLRADLIVRATEGFTPTLQGHRRRLAPVYSLLVATEPLPESVWAQVGLRDRETFSDHRHLIIYGQRTADNRLVFGGRGAPYHFGSRIAPGYDRVPAVFAALHATLAELLPAVAGARITHSWGGPLGIARDWRPSVGLDRTTGLAWAGGYVGDGVSTSNLAGRTLTDLILRRDTDLTTLPWVNHQSPQWEIEPLRWLGANAGLSAMTWADRAEQRAGRPSKLAGLVNRMMGR